MAKVIGIVGSRRRNTGADYDAVLKAFNDVYEKGDTIVSGGCPTGGDAFAEHIAKVSRVDIKIYYAQWHKLGRGAGFARNTDIAQDAGVLIACVAPDRKGGTEDTIRKFVRFHPGGKLILV